jgi:SAM-dependent methyltransferase
VNSPFDVLADSYVSTWSESPQGQEQRQQVWREIDGLFHPGDKILDLGCGAGDDALYFQSRGVDVCAIDSSSRMVELARNRGVNAHWKWMEDLRSIEGKFAGAYSDFGALNCLAQLEPLARDLSRMLSPGSPVALCVMGPFCWRESLRSLLDFKPRKAARRWSGRTVWRGMPIRYWSQSEMRHAFEPHFDFLKRVAIGKGDHQLYLFQRSRP